MPSDFRGTASVIVPVHYGGEAFERCISSLAACVPAPAEIIVVADGITDGAWKAARNMGFRVLVLPAAEGPAAARNRGAEDARGDYLMFVDADVAVPADAVGRITAGFHDHPEAAAIFGSYDDRPAAENFLSQYKNLFHHYVHQRGAEEASTFWAGCGAVRRDVFQEAGGFDEGFRRPCIEDIELGYRLRKAGHRIRLDKGLQVTHLKRWDAIPLLRTEILCRALPWTELILAGGPLIDDLNLTRANRLKAACACLLLPLLVPSVAFPWLLAGAGALTAALILLDLDLYRFFRRKRGAWFALKTMPMVWLYYLYSSLAFAFGYVRHVLGQGRQVRPPRNGPHRRRA